MIVTWNYRERDTFIQRLDPRTRVIFFICATLAIIQTWDIRLLLGWLALTAVAFRVSKVTWQETRRFWLFVLPLITFLVLITAITGRGGVEAYQVEHFIYVRRFSLPLLGERVFDMSVEQLVYAAGQFVRMICMAALGLLVTFTIHPAQYGVTFRRLGLSDKFAVATDLAFRLVPTVAHDFQVTLDAQRARGYELERRPGVSLVQQIRNLAPLIIPVTIGTLLRGEEIVDAMDLRAFGAVPRRTWIVELRYRRADYVVLTVAVLALALTTWGNVVGLTDLWVPPFLLP